MRCVGDGAGRSRHQERGRRERLPVGGQPLRQGPGVTAGGLPPRPAPLSAEAHHPEGRRPPVAAHQLGRGLQDHGGRHPCQPGQVRQGNLHLYGRHVAYLVHGPLRRLQAAVRQPQRHSGQRDLQGAALLRHGHRRLQRLQLDGSGGPPARVRAVGRRFRALQLRRQLPYHGGRGHPRRQAHHRGPRARRTSARRRTSG